MSRNEIIRNIIFNTEVSNKAKANAENLNTLLFRTINFINSPSENILIGDSRTDALPYKLIEKLTKKKFKKLNTNATLVMKFLNYFILPITSIK